MPGGVPYQPIDFSSMINTFFAAKNAAEQRGLMNQERQKQDEERLALADLLAAGDAATPEQKQRLMQASPQAYMSLEDRQQKRLAEQQTTERNKALYEAIRYAKETGDTSRIHQYDPKLGLKYDEMMIAQGKARADTGATIDKQRAAFDFGAAQQVARDPGAADALAADAERLGTQVPGTRVFVEGEDRPIEVPPDIAAARSMAESLGAKIEAPSSTDLRKEVMGSQLFKTTQDIKIAHNKVMGAPPNNTGDISLIYGLMKLEDPGSSVKEGEYDSAKASMGAYGRFSSVWDRVVKGETLDDATRKKFKAEAARLYRSQRETLDPQLDEYRRIAKQAGASPDDVVLDVWGDKQRAAQMPGEPVVATAPGTRPASRPKPLPPQAIGNIKSAYAAQVAKGASPEQALANLVQARAITPEQAQQLLAKLKGAP